MAHLHTKDVAAVLCVHHERCSLVIRHTPDKDLLDNSVALRRVRFD